MTNQLTRARTQATIGIQLLEDRRLLAVFGTAWPNARDLTVSFPTDGAQVGNYDNEVNALLDSIASRQDWQELALRAYQTWAVHADLNVGLRNDYNNDFGVPGMAVGDPRFGEFRVGAFPQQGLIASSIPFQAIAGTNSGDLLLNSNEQFTFHDWSGNQGPDPSTIGLNDRDLFSLLLHESGNTLGLDDNLDVSSVMFRQYTVPKGILTNDDITAIQSLYGQRTDPYESVDNGQVQLAQLIPTPAGLDPHHEVIRTRGSLVTGTDVDVYKIVPVAGADAVTIRLRARGVSLLQSRLEVVDSLGQVISQSGAASVFENDNEIVLSGIAGQAEVYLRVSAIDPSDIYSVGDYWLEVDYRSAAQQASDPTAGAYDSGPDTLFANYDLADTELGTNESIADATDVLANTSANNRFEIESAVSTATDVDYFKLTAPSTVSGRMMVHVAGVGAARPDVRVQIVDASGQHVGTGARLRADGTFTVEVASPQASQDYYLRIAVDPNSAVGVGNYVALAEFETPATQMNDLVSGELTDASDRYVRWTAEKTKLFRFDLEAMSANPDHAVRLTVYDAHTRQIQLIAVTRAGITRGALAWLQQGEYILRFTALSGTPSGTAPPITGLSFSLKADGISDDQDEDNVDPADDPNHDPYSYDDSYGSGYYEYQYEDDMVYDYYDYYTGN